MNKLRFPLLQHKDSSEYPTDGNCPVCSQTMRDGFAYFSLGSVLNQSVKNDVNYDDTQFAFFDVGFHSPNPEMIGSGNVSIVNDLVGGQFTVQFCSINCLHRFFEIVIEELHASVSRPPEEGPGLDDLNGLLDDSAE